MTPKQEAFVREYLIDLNASAAYKRAGYAAKGNAAEVNAARLLRHAQVAAAIQVEMDKRAERTQITADYVLEGIRDTVERCRAEGEAFNPKDALKGFELLGKHLKLFTDKTEVTGADGKDLFPSRTEDEERNMLADRLAEAITRVGGKGQAPTTH